jgi:hypothetical protein
MEKDLGMASNISFNTKNILKDIKQTANKNISKNIPKIQRVLDERIEKIVFQRLVSGLPTIQGRDLAEIGVPDINTRLTSIVQTVAQNVRVKIVLAGSIQINVTILEEDYSDILSLPEAIYTYTSANGSGVLEWLKWILLGGSGPVIGGFEFSPLASPFSRTGGGLMVAGAGWSVPPNLAGTASSNILTRSLENIEQDIKIIVNQEMQRIFK